MWRIRKILRFVKRLVSWIPVLWIIETWDGDYLIDIIEKHIRDMERDFTKHSKFMDYKKVVRQMRVILEHIKRYKDIYAYTESVDDNEWKDNAYWVPCENACCTLMYKDEGMHHKHRLIYEKISRLTDWHFAEIFRLLGKNLQRWWD